MARKPQKAANRLTHVSSKGEARMVDVGGKEVTSRCAVARAEVRMSREAMKLLKAGNVAKGDALAVARIAGIQAAKRTPELIPLCHPLQLSKVEVTIKLVANPPKAVIEATVKCEGKTGVEMEALTAASVAGLTLYDMLKAVDKSMVIGEIALHAKTGGKSGDYRRAK